MTLTIQQCEQRDKTDPTVYRDEWCAVIHQGKTKLYQSTGYAYVSEARRAAEIWFELHN